MLSICICIYLSTQIHTHRMICEIVALLSYIYTNINKYLRINMDIFDVSAC